MSHWLTPSWKVPYGAMRAFSETCKSRPGSLLQLMTLNSREDSYRSQGTSKAFLIDSSLIILRNAMAKAAASWVWLEAERLCWWATQMIDTRQLLDFPNVHTNSQSHTWQHAAKPFYSPDSWSFFSSQQILTFIITTGWVWIPFKTPAVHWSERSAAQHPP